MNAEQFALMMSAAQGAIKLGTDILDALRRDAELTPEQDAEAEAMRRSAYTDPAWQAHGGLKNQP